MVYYDTNVRLQLAREHADRLASEMRRSRRVSPDVAGYPRLARLGSALAGHIESLRRHRGTHTPAYDA
jgi:hypothetical protein